MKAHAVRQMREGEREGEKDGRREEKKWKREKGREGKVKKRKESGRKESKWNRKKVRACGRRRGRKGVGGSRGSGRGRRRKMERQ